MYWYKNRLEYHLAKSSDVLMVRVGVNTEQQHYDYRRVYHTHKWNYFSSKNVIAEKHCLK